jgi:hypothetical protein
MLKFRARVVRQSVAGCCVLAGLAYQTGCNQGNDGAAEAPVPVAPSISAATASGGSQVLAEPTEKQFPGIRLTIPAGWEERPLTSEFIQAEYSVAGDDGAARVTLSSAGGGVDANLERWQSQFQRGPDDPEPVRTDLRVDGVDAVILELHGTFRDGFGGGGPRQNWTMLGAVIPTGPANFFLKMTGPKTTVAAAREQFIKLVESASLK